MYSYIIKLAHGFTLIPTILAFKNKKIFKLLNHPKSISELIKLTKFNSGYLIAGLNILCVFSIIKRKGNQFFYETQHPLVSLVNKNFLIFYNQDFNNLLLNRKNLNILNKFSKYLSSSWKIDKIDDQIIDGCFLIPLFFSLKLNKKKDFINDKKYRIVNEILLKKKLIKKNGKKFLFSSAGSYVINNINIIGVAASYKNMLFKYEDLLTKNPDLIFKTKNNIEGHIDRNLNIEASSSQHEKYFNRIEKIIEKIYRKKHVPMYVMDVGCGDGLLLKKIYQNLKKILSKRNLKKITLIGVDLNKISLISAKKNLSKMKTIFIKESIDNPKNIFKLLKNKNISHNEVLQVRSFVDHEREIFSSSKKIYFDNDNVINKNDRDVISIDKSGEIISSKIINQSLNMYYKKWSNFISKFGIINLEVHKQSLKDMKNNLNLNEGAHFDFIQALSRQNLCKAKIQLYCMIKNNLKPKIIEAYPINTNFVRIILGYYKKSNSSLNFKRQIFKRAINFLTKGKNFNT